MKRVPDCGGLELDERLESPAAATCTRAGWGNTVPAAEALRPYVNNSSAPPAEPPPCSMDAAKGK